MRNIFKDIKIWRELKRFEKFKEKYNFIQKKIEENSNGKLMFDGIVLRESKEAETVSEGETFVNVSFKSGNSLSKILSNLFPYKFYFIGHQVDSIEAVIQSLKFNDKKSQKKAIKYSGIVSNNIKFASNYDWKKSQKFSFFGLKMQRNSEKYAKFIDKLYISAIQNPLYRNALLNVGDKYILHSIGNENPEETLLTRYEFEKEMNCLKEFLANK